MMIVLRGEGKIVHSQFRCFPDHLKAGDVLALNDTKVIPAKAWGAKDGREIEFLFLKKNAEGHWEVLCRPAKRVKVGDWIIFGPGFEGRVTGMEARGKRLLRFRCQDVLARLKKIGYAPLPPYIKRGKNQADLRRLDLERYQTVFAQTQGSIAAPTAGLHFTPQILEKIKTRGIEQAPISLQVGQATFQPVTADRVEAHVMLDERYAISLRSSRMIKRAKTEGRPVVAVGTTVVRTLESAWKEGRLQPGTRWTDLFIFPGYRFKVVDRLLTNFHLPKSTLLMLVSAFAGTELIRDAYAEAVRQRYRFYSYGDCMLII
jgi:S-adenosylmethionine:tRNA ribosyltransferase-isomerase